MQDFFKQLLRADFMPHGHCYFWDPAVLWLNVVSDGLITMAYYSIPVTLAWFIYKRRDVPYSWIFIMFAGFIVACGTTHLMEIWTVWHGTYRLAGLVKALTALLSVSTAVLLVRVLPLALTLRSPTELAKLNAELERQISERERAEEQLRRSREELEDRVEARTEALEEANRALQAGIAKRQQGEEALRQSEERFRLVVEAAPSAMVMMDERGAITLVNSQTERLFGYAREEMLGQSVEMLVPERSRPQQPQARPELLGAGRDLFGLCKSGTEIPIESALTRLRTSEGAFVLASIVDITERSRTALAMQESLQEKETLLKEIHHRVKNNMQLISSLLQLQSGYIRNPEALAIFRESRDRIRSMALIHEKLYQSTSLAEIDLAEYVRGLVGMLMRTYDTKAQAVRVESRIEGVSLSLEAAVPIGLILNELISNSLKHGYPGDRSGCIHVSLQVSGGAVELVVRDDGVGCPPGLDWRESPSLGLRLIRMLSEQLQGVVTMRSEPGVEFRLTFHEPKLKERASTYAQHTNLCS